MFEEIENLLKNVKATSAEVADQLLKDYDANECLQGLIDFLHKKIRENEEAEVKKTKEAAKSATKENVAPESVQKEDAEEKKQEWHILTNLLPHFYYY